VSSTSNSPGLGLTGRLAERDAFHDRMGVGIAGSARWRRLRRPRAACIGMLVVSVCRTPPGNDLVMSAGQLPTLLASRCVPCGCRRQARDPTESGAKVGSSGRSQLEITTDGRGRPFPGHDRGTTFAGVCLAVSRIRTRNLVSSTGVADCICSGACEEIADGIDLDLPHRDAIDGDGCGAADLGVLRAISQKSAPTDSIRLVT
jgi:hypothetical protein